VIGAGAIGSIAAQVARAYGAETVAVIEPSAFKRNLALKLGAGRAFDPQQERLEEQVREFFGGNGADVVLECCGIARTYQLAVRLVRQRGVVGALGYVDEQIPFPMRPIIFGEVSIVGSTGFHWPDDPAIEMIADGRVNVKPLITHTFDLERAQQAYETAGAPDAVKVVIIP
jgi:threonine dehydrogenase-like Zn-dependent dehydrogenase